MAEVAQPSPSSSGSGWGQSAQHPSVSSSGSRSGRPPSDSGGWGASASGEIDRGRAVGVCGSCLNAVHETDLHTGAEKLKDGRLHCKACAAQLKAGTICSKCYQRFSQKELRGKQVATHKSRAYHRACIKRSR